jgi:5'-nucleotidase / UDP-sugar diphosphatase
MSQPLLHIIQCNDIYEIFRWNDQGGFANIAGYINQLLYDGNKVIIVCPGDLFSPSPVSDFKPLDPHIPNKNITLPSGKLYGAHCIDMLNELGRVLNIPVYVTFGNHEWDIPADDILERLRESTHITWLASNVSDLHDTHLKHIIKQNRGKTSSKSIKETIKTKNILQSIFKLTKNIELYHLSKDITIVLYGIIGGCGIPYKECPLQYNGNTYKLNNFFPQKNHIKCLEKSVETDPHIQYYYLPLTHLEIDQDQNLTKVLGKNTLLICGGHDHTAMKVKGASNIYIYKPDSDLRTFYHHTLIVKNSRLQTHSELIKNDHSNNLAHPTIQRVQRAWKDFYFDNYKLKHDIDLNTPLGTPLKRDLDFQEQTPDKTGYRQNQHELYLYWLKHLADMAQNKLGIQIDIAVSNSGSFRFDGVMPKGTQLTQYQLLKFYPFKDTVILGEFRDKIQLQSFIESINPNNKGTGCYAQIYYPLRNNKQSITINDKQFPDNPTVLSVDFTVCTTLCDQEKKSGSLTHSGMPPFAEGPFEITHLLSQYPDLTTNALIGALEELYM